MNFSSKRLVAVSLTFLLVFAGVPGLAAAESRAGGTVVVSEGETVRDLEAFGGSVVVLGTVDGDLSVLGGDVRVVGEVTGDVSAVSGDVRVAGRVGGDASAVGGRVVVTPEAEIAGDLTAVGGTVALDGAVLGSATLAGDEITLGPTARVGGDLTYDGSLARAAGATVGGSVVRDDLGVGSAVLGRPFGDEGAFDFFGFVVNLAAGAALLVVFPRFSRGVVARATDSPLRTGGVGLLTLVGVPVALVVVALTVVGIPLSLVGAVLFGLAVWVGALYGRFAVGSWLAATTGVDNEWVALASGFVAVALAIRLPVLGGVVDLAVLLVGLGALAVTLRSAYGRRRSQSVEDGADGADDSVVRPA